MARVPAYAPLCHQEAGQGTATSSMTTSTLSTAHWDRTWRRHSENGAPAIFVCFVVCAVWSTLVVWYSQEPSQPDAAPAWPYFYALDWFTNILLYFWCMFVIPVTAGQDWTPIVTTSVSAQLGSAGLHLILLLVYWLVFEDKQYPNMVVVWKAWSGWLNVAMAGMMLLRNHGVGWAEEFYGVEREKGMQQTQQSSV